MAFPSYDKDTDCIRLNGAQVIMLTLLMKARFGEPFDPEVIFNPGVTELIRQLEAALGPERPTPGHCFTSHQDMWTIAKAVYDDSFQNGWWGLAESERASFLQDAVAPWILSDDQIERVIDHVDSRLFSAQRIVKKEAAEHSRQS